MEPDTRSEIRVGGPPNQVIGRPQAPQKALQLEGSPQILPPAPPRAALSAAPVDPAAQIAALRQQIASLQAAVAALQLKTQLISSNGVTFSVASGASAVTVSPAGVAVTSPIVMLNGNGGNGKPAARVQDMVMTNGVSGTITHGSTTVLIGD